MFLIIHKLYYLLIYFLDCPYKCLTEGHVSDRLQHVSDRLLLLDYLLTELMGARILHEKKPSKKIELKLVSRQYSLAYLNLKNINTIANKIIVMICWGNA